MKPLPWQNWSPAGVEVGQAVLDREVSSFLGGGFVAALYGKQGCAALERRPKNKGKNNETKYPLIERVDLKWVRMLQTHIEFG